MSRCCSKKTSSKKSEQSLRYHCLKSDCFVIIHQKSSKTFKFCEIFRFSSKMLVVVHFSFLKILGLYSALTFFSVTKCIQKCFSRRYTLFCASRVFKMQNKLNQKQQKLISQNLNFCVFFVTQLGTGALSGWLDKRDDSRSFKY